MLMEELIVGVRGKTNFHEKERPLNVLNVYSNKYGICLASEQIDEKTIEQIIARQSKSSYLKQVEKSHSSVITYEYFQIEDVDWYFDKQSWKKPRSIGLVRKTIEKNKDKVIELRYYISSLFIDIYDFSKAIRMHWSVENKLHWHLNFTFRQDNNTTKNKSALMDLEIINKFVLAILNKVKHRYSNISLKRIRSYLTSDFENEFMDLLRLLAIS